GPSGHLEIFRRSLAAVADQFVFDHLTLVESPEACTFDRRDVDEHILVSSRRLDEPVAFGRVEPFDSAFLHVDLLVLSRTSRGSAHRMPRHNQVSDCIRIPIEKWGATMANVCTRHMPRSEEHTSELQSQSNLVCRLLLEKKNQTLTN